MAYNPRQITRLRYKDQQTLEKLAEQIKDGTTTKWYRHELVIITDKSDQTFIDYLSPNNLKVDSLQDLTTLVKPTPTTRLSAGNTYFKYENSVWKDKEDNLVVSVDDNVEVAD